VNLPRWPAQQLERLLSVGRREHLIARLFQDPLRHAPQIGFILDHQNGLASPLHVASSLDTGLGCRG
jgi:hypothetical protein